MSKRVKIYDPTFERVKVGERSIQEVVKDKKAKLRAQRNVAERTLMTFVNGGEDVILQQRMYMEYSPYTKSELEKLNADRFDEVRRNHFVDLEVIEGELRKKVQPFQDGIKECKDLIDDLDSKISIKNAAFDVEPDADKKKSIKKDIDDFKKEIRATEEKAKPLEEKASPERIKEMRNEMIIDAIMAKQKEFKEVFTVKD